MENHRIDKNLWQMCADLAERKARVPGPNAEFWKRLAGSLRKAASL